MRKIVMLAPQWVLKSNRLRPIFRKSDTPCMLIIDSYSNLCISPLPFWSLANIFLKEEGIQALISIYSQINLLLPDWRVSFTHPSIHPSVHPPLHLSIQSSILQPTSVFLLGNPMDRGTWWATIQGCRRIGHDLTNDWTILPNYTAICLLEGYGNDKWGRGNWYKWAKS